MSTLPLAVLAQLALSCPAVTAFPPGRVLDRVASTAQAESGLETTAVHDNTTRQSYRPASETEAVALVSALHLQGHSLDAGIMQVNDSNWARLGLTPETAFDPRANICAGMTVLAEAYSVERRVSCRYNSGRPNCTNGYPERIEDALHHLRAMKPIAPAETQPQASLTAMLPPVADPFIRHAPAREVTFAPSFRPAAQLRDGTRPAAPAVPASFLAVPTQTAGELTPMRSSNR